MQKTHTSSPSELQPRKRWQEPEIILERSLEAKAQEGPPGIPGYGGFGPLASS